MVFRFIQVSIFVASTLILSGCYIHSKYQPLENSEAILITKEMWSSAVKYFINQKPGNWSVSKDGEKLLARTRPFSKEKDKILSDHYEESIYYRSSNNRSIIIKTKSSNCSFILIPIALQGKYIITNSKKGCTNTGGPFGGGKRTDGFIFNAIHIDNSSFGIGALYINEDKENDISALSKYHNVNILKDGSGFKLFSDSSSEEFKSLFVDAIKADLIQVIYE